ncbi:hypothetical protein CXG81DRAFT_1089, partial [Caulochytrium protostelioides]
FGVHDTMREGFRSMQAEMMPGHPLKHHLEHYEATQDELRLTMLRGTVGSHLPLKLQMERAIVADNAPFRLFGGRDASLDVLMGRNERLDVEDVLGAGN